VFVVDDVQMRDSVVTSLEAFSFEAMPCGAPGMFYRHRRFDMPGRLVLDVRTPRQTGLQLYEQWLCEEKRRPAIDMTAHADATTAAAMKTGAIEFLEQPFSRDLLANRARRALALEAPWRQEDSQFARLDVRSPGCRLACARR
jgi:FixJ family two-component response regulator